MADKARFGLGDFLLLLLVLVVAAGLRITYLTAVAGGAGERGPLLVQEPSPKLPVSTEASAEEDQRDRREVMVLVHNLREHGWFGSQAPLAVEEESTAHTSPGYPLILAIVARVVGLSNLETATHWLQVILGSLTAVFYFLFAQRAFRSRLVATLAGLFCALHPFWIINTTEINDGVAASFLLSLCLYLGILATQTAGAASSFLYGLSLALLALVRAALLPFGFVAMLWFLWRCRRLEGGWLCSLLAFLGFINGLVPWTMHNQQTFGEPVPVVDSAYLHLWMGNNAHATGGPQEPELMLEALADHRGEEVATVRKELSEMEQPRRYRNLARPTMETIAEDPGEFVRHRLQAAVVFMLGEQWLKKGKLAEEAYPDTYIWLADAYSAILGAALLGMILLALLGWRWTYAWRHEAMLTSLALIWIPLPYLLGHAGALHGPRLPLDGVLLTYAAFALACLWPPVGNRLWTGPEADLKG